MHVVHDAPAVVDHENLLAAGVDDHAELRSERGHKDRELTQLFLELLERARADVLGHDPVHRDDLDPEAVEKLGKELRGGAVRVVDDDLRFRVGDLFSMRDLREERIAVRLSDPWRFVDPPNIVVRDAAQILAKEDRLDLPLLRLVHVEGLAIEELDVAHADVEWRHSHVDSAGRPNPTRLEPSDGQRRLEQVGDVHAGAHDAAHETALEHAARAVLIPVHRDRRAD